MGMEDRESNIQKILRDLCFSNGCSYGVLWRFDPRNHMLLTMEDACCEEHAGSLVESMRLQVHIVGEGKVGEAALDGKHRWVSVGSPTKGHNAAWDDSDIALQISFGIKTIVVIPLELHGVVQFGFTKEILETPELLDQARKFLLGTENSVEHALAGSASSSLNYHAVGQNELLASVISSQKSFHSDVDVSTSWANVAENVGNSWMLDSLPFPGGHFDGKYRDQSGDGELIVDPNFDSVKDNGDASDICTNRLHDPLDMFEGQFNAHCSPSLFESYEIDDFSQWLAEPSKLCVSALDSLVTDDVSPTFKVDCLPSVAGGTESASCLQNALNSCREDKSWGEPANSDELLVDQFEIGTDCRKWGDCMKDAINPIGDTGNPLLIDASMSISECISGLEGSPVLVPRKGLFSELGLECLLRGRSSTNFVTKSCMEEQWTTSKKRRIGTCQTSNNQTQLCGNFWGVKSMQPTSNGAQLPHFGSLNGKSHAELRIDDIRGMDAKSCVSGVSAPTKRPEEPPKPTKKRAKPGESTRPRPKDRQMIADRLKELRDMIPNGAKLSIDALLGRTVKHMLFLQSLTKHADKFKHLGKSKLIGQSNSLAQKDNLTSSCSGSRSRRGATWAYEVGGQNLLCPIIVEDLSHPGQMLIEMLCEEQGYFLEIADLVRGLGLTILNGVMESRDDKIWAHYIVEGNRNVTRMDVFLSLMQLLQGSTSTVEVIRASDQPTATVNNGGLSWSNCQHHQHLVPMPLPI